MKPGYSTKCQNANCTEMIFLSEPKHQQSFQARPYWPTGAWPLLFVCPQCRHGSVLNPNDFHHAKIPNAADGEEDMSVWSLTVECSDSNCKSPVVLHTTAASVSASAILSSLVLAGLGEHVCKAGHPLQTPIAGTLHPTLIEGQT